MASQTFVDGAVFTAAQANTLADTVDGYATTATAAGTTTLTVASKYQQFFTGSTTQTVTMPVASTLVIGWKIRIVNNSSGVVTVQSSGANTIYAVPAGGDVIFTCILASGTTAASWDYKNYISTATSGGMTLLSTTALSGTTTTVSGISASYNDLLIFITAADKAGAIRINGSAVLFQGIQNYMTTTTIVQTALNNSELRLNAGDGMSASNIGTVALRISNYANASNWKPVMQWGGFQGSSHNTTLQIIGHQKTTSAISSIDVVSDGGSFTTGSILVYGVK